MKKGNYRVVLGIFFVSALLALTGCPDTKEGKVTGGGWIVGLGPNGGKASFGFNANSCPAAEGTTKIGLGRFNYHEKDGYLTVNGLVDVKMNGWITEVHQCVEGPGDPNGDPCEDSIFKDHPLGLGYYEFTVEFRSTNPKWQEPAPGVGIAKVCVWDNGEGANGDGDHVRIVVTSGTYAGYKAEGDVQGNIRARTCDDA